MGSTAGNKQMADNLLSFSSFLPWQNDHHFTEDILKYFFVNEKFCISIQISLKFVPEGSTDYKSSLVQVMAWCWTADKPLPEPLLIQFAIPYMGH